MGTKWECAGASSATCLEKNTKYNHGFKVFISEGLDGV